MTNLHESVPLKPIGIDDDWQPRDDKLPMERAAVDDASERTAEDRRLHCVDGR